MPTCVVVVENVEMWVDSGWFVAQPDSSVIKCKNHGRNNEGTPLPPPRTHQLAKTITRPGSGLLPFRRRSARGAACRGRHATAALGMRRARRPGPHAV